MVGSPIGTIIALHTIDIDFQTNSHRIVMPRIAVPIVTAIIYLTLAKLTHSASHPLTRSSPPKKPHCRRFAPLVTCAAVGVGIAERLAVQAVGCIVAGNSVKPVANPRRSAALNSPSNPPQNPTPATFPLSLITLAISLNPLALKKLWQSSASVDAVTSVGTEAHDPVETADSV
jgi:hypothetical protein